MLRKVIRYINYIFYSFLAIHLMVLIKYILLNKDLDSYMSIQNQYGAVLTTSNIIFISLLTLRYFLKQIAQNNKSFFYLIRKNKTIIVGNIIFILLIVVNGVIEEEILHALHHAHTNLFPIHIILYGVTLYLTYTQYSEISHQYKSLTVKKNESRKQKYIDITSLTIKSFRFFFITSGFIFLSGKTDLAKYIIRIVNITFLLVVGTNILIFIALFILHLVKKHKKKSLSI